jgi:hypothetical protein
MPRGRDLSDYSADEAARLVASKGDAFQQLAERLRMTDFQGELITHELQQGDGHFLQFSFELVGWKTNWLADPLWEPSSRFRTPSVVTNTGVSFDV